MIRLVNILLILTLTAPTIALPNREVSSQDCVALLRAMAADSLSDAPILVFRDFVEDGKANLNSIDQAHKAALIEKYLQVDVQLRTTEKHRAPTKALLTEMRGILGNSEMSDLQAQKLLAGGGAIQIVIPQEGVSPFLNWDPKRTVKKTTVKGQRILKDGHFVKLPPGSITIESTKKIKEGIWISDIPVTQLQYALRTGGRNPSGRIERGVLKINQNQVETHHPVTNVNAFEAELFCELENKSQKELWKSGGKKGKYYYYRLPTEHELEYAIRAGTTTEFSFNGNEENLAPYGWFDENSQRRPQRVGQKEPNPWGLRDVHGNVMQWTSSYRWQASSLIIRGGFWCGSARDARSSFRDSMGLGVRSPSVGFRVVREERPK